LYQTKAKLKMEKIKEKPQNNSGSPKKHPQISFCWVFNPDGSVESSGDHLYSKLLEIVYKPATSGLSYLGG